MPDLNIQNIIDSILKEAELVINQSQNILLNGGAGLQGNNFFSGYHVETFIIDILKRLLPDRFNVVSGYIIDHTNFANHADLKQVDCIIVDKAFPIFYTFKNLNINIVTKESVCGIIEIKRNLHNQVDSSILHIAEIVAQAGIVKNDNTSTIPFIHLSNAPGNNINSPYKSNPLIGIIALQSGYPTEHAFDTVAQKIENANSLLDFVWCVDGASLLTEQAGGIISAIHRATNDSWCRLSQQNAWNRNHIAGGTTSQHKILWRVFGFITSYLLYVTGKNDNQTYMNNYYFNNNIF